MDDGDFLQHHWGVWLVTAVTRDAGDGLDHLEAGIVALAEDRVVLIKRNGVDTSVIKNWLPLVLGPELAIASLPGLSKFKLGSNSSANLYPGLAHAGAGWVTALDHEIGNDAMKGGAVE